MKCVFTWQPALPLKEYLLENVSPQLEIEFIDHKAAEADIIEKAKEATVLVGWLLSKKILEAAEKLKYILYPGAGVQHISKEVIDCINSRAIIFTNSHSNSFATAQHACALTFALGNQIITNHQLLKDCQWRTGDKEAKSISLRNKKIGLLGFGAIGQQIYKMMKGFEVRFLVYKNSHQIAEKYQNDCQLFSAEKDHLNDFLQQTDILICSLPQTNQTKNLINETNISYLKKEALLINVGRGDVINETALYLALKEKRLAGAAIDVWYDYKPTPNEAGQKYPFKEPFHELKNIVLSPHRAASPMDDPFRFEDLLYNLNEAVKTKPSFKNVINFEVGY